MALRGGRGWGGGGGWAEEACKLGARRWHCLGRLCCFHVVLLQGCCVRHCVRKLAVDCLVWPFVLAGHVRGSSCIFQFNSMTQTGQVGWQHQSIANSCLMLRCDHANSSFLISNVVGNVPTCVDALPPQEHVHHQTSTLAHMHLIRNPGKVSLLRQAGPVPESGPVPEGVPVSEAALLQASCSR